MLMSSLETHIEVKSTSNVSQERTEIPRVRPVSARNRQIAIAEFEQEGLSTVPALVSGADVLVQFRERHLALALLRQALTQDSFHVSTLRRIYALLDKGEWSLAERLAIAETLSSTTHLASDTVRLAKLEYENGSLDRALDLYFDAAAQIHDEDHTIFEIYKDIGNIFVRRGDFEGAEEYYHKAYAVDPDSDALQVNLGTLEIQREDWGSARDRFRDALAINDQNDKAWVGLALAHYHLGDVDLAFANLEKATDLVVENRTAILLLANWAEKHDRVRDAIQPLERYLDFNNFDEDIALLLIRSYCAEKNYLAARFELEKILLWTPQRSEFLALMDQIVALEFAIEEEAARTVTNRSEEIFGA